MSQPTNPGRPLRLHEDEVQLDDDLVRLLVDEQFPHLIELALERVASTGTDNAIYRLGPHLGLRLPRIHWAVRQVTKEHDWLPRLAPRLPVALAEPVEIGRPGRGYPYPWLVYRWLHGHDAMVGPVRDWVHLANQVAEALAALQAVDVAGAPPSGPRGGLLADRDRAVRWAIAQLDDVLASERATAVWEAGLDARPWTKRPVWVHGDLLPGNLLLRDDQLIGIIDWGAAGVGDPACDAMLAWAMPADARHDFHLAAGFDEDTWVRGKAWALEQAVFFAPYYAETIPEAAAAARRRLAAILAERPPVGGKRGRD